MPYIDKSALGGNVVVTAGYDEEARADIVELQENDIETDALLAETVFYDEITFEKFRDNTSLTDYYLTTIPNMDSKGNLIKLEHGFSDDIFNSGSGESAGESARNFAIRGITSFTANASTFDTTTLQPRGMQIKDGVVLQENLNNPSNRYFLGIKDDNTLVAYPPATTSAQMLDEGCIHALTGFFPMIENSLAVDPTVYGSDATINPRQAIAQMPNNDIIFFSCEGRNNKDAGMTYADMIRILLAQGVTFAYNLDGGGSSQTLVRGVLLNNPIDDGGKTERLVPDFLYVKKPSTNPQNIATLNKDIGIVNKRLKDLTWDILLMGDISETSKAVADCNVLMPSGIYWMGSSTLNKPTTDISWGLIHFKSGSASASQVAIPYHNSLYNIKMRRTDVADPTGWGPWRSVYDAKKGTLTYNGDGIATSKTIPHGLGVIPNYYQVSPLSVAAGTAGIKYVTADATNLTVFFNVAPATGTNNIVLNWKAEV
jgi:hypothetical protein